MSEDVTRSALKARKLHAQADIELEQLRAAALLLARELKEFGKARIGAASADLEEASLDLLHNGKDVAGDMQRRLIQAEHRIETSMRAHPGNWFAGTLGAVGLGLVLSAVLRGRD
jgi:hypothetical protein